MEHITQLDFKTSIDLLDFHSDNYQVVITLYVSITVDSGYNLFLIALVIQLLKRS